MRKQKQIKPVIARSKFALEMENRTETLDKISALRHLHGHSGGVDEVQEFMDFMLLFHGREISREKAIKMMGR